MFTALDGMNKLVYFGSLLWMLNGIYASDTVVTDIASFDVSVGDRDVGTIEIGLFGLTAPKTVKNFLYYVRGEGEFSYSGSPFHRVIEDFMVQGGDVVFGNGSGEVSIYGGRFDDENFTLHHYGAGWLSMANAGPDSNTCQFFITARSTWWLDDKHVVFGKVLRGMWVVKQILNVETDSNNNKPIEDVVITKSYASKPKEEFTVAKVGCDWLI